MNFRFRYLLLILLQMIPLQGQTPKDAFDMNASLNFTQSNHDNWAQGGENVLSWFVDVKAAYKQETDQNIIQGNGHVNYGKTKLDSAPERKSTDELKLDGLYTRKLGWAVNPYASMQLLTQLAPGYVYSDTGKIQISSFMDPGYLIQTVGMGYASGEWIAVRSGLSLKETVTDQYPIGDGMDKISIEYGIQAECDVKKKMGDKAVFTSEMDLFSNLESLDQIDVIWDTNMTTHVSEFLQFGFQYKVVYDKDVSAKRQVKSVLSIGINYTFL